jgi:molybdopterin synthase sulfur carrier subunit
MMIRLRYFASIREFVGSAEDEVQLPSRSSVESLMEAVKNLHGSLKDVETILVAVNGEYADPMNTLEDGDVVALFPPVSGG